MPVIGSRTRTRSESRAAGDRRVHVSEIGYQGRVYSRFRVIQSDSNIGAEERKMITGGRSDEELIVGRPASGLLMSRQAESSRIGS